MIPPITINTNDRIKITVTNIFVKLHINTGNAVSQVTLVSSGLTLPVVSSIHFPIKGTDVLSSTPQQTHFLLHGSQTLSIFLVQSGHEQVIQFRIHHLGPSPKSQPAHKFDCKA